MNLKISRRIGSFLLDRRLLVALLLLGVGLSGRAWLNDHPQHDPWAPLDLDSPAGWVTGQKLAGLRANPEDCRVALEQSEVVFASLESAGSEQCYRDDRIRLASDLFSPRTPSTTCAVSAGMYRWIEQSVRPAAHDIFEAEILTVEHYGAFSCRRMYGASEGRWSEHATANAIDIAGFYLSDDIRVSVQDDWNGAEDKARFLRRIRDEACEIFATVLSPDYNVAHADHFHFDQADRTWGSCR